MRSKILLLTMATLSTKTDRSSFARGTAQTMRFTSRLLVITVWSSAGLFGLYILAFYAAALTNNNMEQLNQNLPNLYSKNSPGSVSGIGIHFAAGGIILILGSIQLIEAIRVRYSAFHRWVGRIYVVACLLASIGGFAFIFIKGTIGGIVMDIGFTLYGILMFIAAIQTIRHARAGRFEIHSAWAIRLYALAIGSWLYRMDYGFWFFLTDGYGHGENFSGGFDKFMDFWFYLPNLLVAEIYIRQKTLKLNPVLNIFSSILLLGLTAFLILGTYQFTKIYWGPAIIGWIFGK